MKKLLFTIFAACVITAFSGGCHKVRTVSGGLDNDAFLEFVGNPSNYDGGVDVTVDETNKFRALVKKDYAESSNKGYVYQISKGTHTLSVSYQRKVLYQNKIFVSPQETKKIVLP